MIKKNKNHKKLSTQLDLLMEFFKKNPNQDIAHPKIVDWSVKEWEKRTGQVFRDPDRGIRQLHQKGYLKKIKKGIYHYDPNSIKEKNLENFSNKQKNEILKRDNYKCVICGKGKREGMELHVDHIKPKDLGGKAIISNGQTLCSQHNLMKKTLKQTETGKKMFILLYKLAQEERNKTLVDFCTNILQIYEDYDINGHIEWEK